MFNYYVLFACFNVICNSLQILPSQPTISREYGTNLMLTCFTHYRDPSIMLLWIDNYGNVVENTNNVFIESESKFNIKLYIPRVNNDNIGTFTCKLLSDVQNVNKTVKVKVYIPLQIYNYEWKNIFTNRGYYSPIHHKQIYVDVNSNYIVKYKFYDSVNDMIRNHTNDDIAIIASPSSYILWKFNGKPIQESNVSYSENNSKLFIRNINSESEGEYAIRLESKYDGKFVESSFSIRIKRQLNIIFNNITTNAIANQPFTVMCKTNLNSSEIAFKKITSYPFDYTVLLTDIIIDTEKGSLTFLDPKPEYSGTYECKASHVGSKTVSERGIITITV